MVSEEKARRFPVLMGYQERREHPGCPRDTPWSFVAPHEAQALSNHGQSLETLASRGGLCPSEIRCAVEGKGLFAERTDSKDWPARTARDIEWLLHALIEYGES